MQKILIGISSCLLGEKVRYNGEHKKDPYITETLSNFFEWYPVCPEVGSGLSIPREPMRLEQQKDGSIRLVTINTKRDYTDLLTNFSEQKAKSLTNENICGFIFKGRSPSSAIYDAKIYNEKGVVIKKGAGIFGATFVKNFPLVPVIDDGRLHDPKLRDNFFEKVFCYKRWLETLYLDKTVSGLIKFHTKHKLILMSHSVKHYNLLGKMLSNTKIHSKNELFSEYGKHFMTAMSYIATTKKHLNVLLHCMGYFKKLLTSDEKSELLEILEQFRLGYLPLIVPVTLIKHYTRKFNQPYLSEQYYLNPYPLELMIRNHP